MTWIDDARRGVAEGLAKMARQGSVPAANAVLALLDQESDRLAAAEERDRLMSGADEMCFALLGESAMTPDDAAQIVGREVTEEEIAAMKVGALRRRAWVRQVELARVGSGKQIPEWARS